MTLARILRAAALLLVALSVLDPVVPLMSRALPRVGVLTEADSRVAERAIDALGRALDQTAVVSRGVENDSEAFVLVADRYPILPMPSGAPVHVLFVGGSRQAPLAIARVTAPPVGFLGLPVVVTVDLERWRSKASRTPLRLTSRGAAVAAAEVQWREGQRTARATLIYVPTRPGATQLRVVAEAGAEEIVADTLTEIREERFNVQVSGARPSWALSFAAMALEQDDRLVVTARVGTSPGRAVEKRVEDPIGSNVGSRHMARTDIRPDRISAVQLRGGEDWRNVTALRHAAEGGAVVVLAPDGALPGSVGAFAGAESLKEYVAATPLRASNGVRATEWLLAENLNPAATIRASVQVNGREYPLVIDSPMGQGRIVLVTALDAWRYRADTAFGRFWRALITELAAEQAAASQRLRVTPVVVRPGEALSVAYDAAGNVPVNTLAARVVAPTSSARRATLVRHSGSRFIGEIEAPAAEGLHRIEFESAPAAVQRACFVVAAHAVTTRARDETALRALAAAHRGTFVNGGDVNALASLLRGALPAREVRVRMRPMRWSGWGVTLAALLGVEWWTRRRKGMR